MKICNITESFKNVLGKFNVILFCALKVCREFEKGTFKNLEIILNTFKKLLKDD